jgi:hypothetical protein
MLKIVSIGYQSLDAVPFRAGIPKSWTSDLEKFEAPDPAEWCPRGYAIVNVDPRGVGDSDGNIYGNGTQVRSIWDSVLDSSLLTIYRKAEMVMIPWSGLLNRAGAMVPLALSVTRG